MDFSSMSAGPPSPEQSGMARHLTTENFHWYSTVDNIPHLHVLAEAVEADMVSVMEIFETHWLPHERVDNKISIYFYDHDDFLDVVCPEGWAGARENSNKFNGSVYMGSANWAHDHVVVLANPRGRVGISPVLINLGVNEIIKTLMKDMIDWSTGSNQGHWTMGLASHLDGRINLLSYYKEHLWDMVKYDRMPALNDLTYSYFPCHIESQIMGAVLVSIFQFMHETFGMELVFEIIRQPSEFESVFNISRGEFERQWHRWIRFSFDPTTFRPDSALIGTWNSLGNQQSLSSFTERNQRNVNTWAQDIIRQRGNRHQQLTFNNNGRITATGVTGFGNTWTDGSINGRGYEIRTIGGVDYLFVNNQGLTAPRTGAGGPWMVFVRS